MRMFLEHTHKHEIDFNWMGVNFSPERFKVGMKAPSQALLTQAVRWRSLRAGCFSEDDSNYHS